MHPRLTVEHNPECAEQIEALRRCHADRSYWDKLLGACNDPKVLLNQCFRAQKKVKVKASLEKARADRDRVERLWAELQCNDGSQGASTMAPHDQTAQPVR